MPAGPQDRVAAHERLLQERLVEAQAAADGGNMAAVQAALTAYQVEVDAAVADVGYEPALLEFLHTSLVQQTALLETMAISNPGQAAAIQGAIHASETATKKLDEVGGDKDHDGKPDGPPPWAGSPGEHATPPPANGGDNQGGDNGTGQGGSGGGGQGGDRDR
jgi:hypothetical protein